MGVATYQIESIDIGVLAQVLGQVPVGHPGVYKGERRMFEAEPQETDHIRMSQSYPNNRIGAERL